MFPKHNPLLYCLSLIKNCNIAEYGHSGFIYICIADQLTFHFRFLLTFNRRGCCQFNQNLGSKNSPPLHSCTLGLQANQAREYKRQSKHAVQYVV